MSDMDAETKLQLGVQHLLGEVAWLMTNSERHRYLFVNDLERLVLPALRLGQFKLYRHEGVPTGYVSWAFLSEEVEERFIDQPDTLRPSDWKSGDQIWFMEFLVPFGGIKDVTKDLKENVFPDRTVYSLRPNLDGPGFRRVTWHGIEVERQPSAAD